jgi:hypothetical protein
MALAIWQNLMIKYPNVIQGLITAFVSKMANLRAMKTRMGLWFFCAAGRHRCVATALWFFKALTHVLHFRLVWVRYMFRSCDTECAQCTDDRVPEDTEGETNAVNLLALYIREHMLANPKTAPMVKSINRADLHAMTQAAEQVATWANLSIQERVRDGIADESLLNFQWPQGSNVAPPARRLPTSTPHADTHEDLSRTGARAKSVAPRGPTSRPGVTLTPKAAADEFIPGTQSRAADLLSQTPGIAPETRRPESPTGRGGTHGLIGKARIIRRQPEAEAGGAPPLGLAATMTTTGTPSPLSTASFCRTRTESHAPPDGTLRGSRQGGS